MSQTAFITPQSFLDTPDISLKEDSSITGLTTAEEGDVSLINGNSSATYASVDSIEKINARNKEVDELTEKLDVLKTRLDFKLLIASTSKTTTLNKDFFTPENFNHSKNISIVNNKFSSPYAKCEVLKDVRNIHTVTPFSKHSSKLQVNESCIECIKEAQTQAILSHHLSNTNDKQQFIEPEPNNTQNEMYVWTGSFPERNYKNPKFSNKVFLGGIPWDMTEQGLRSCFKKFGSCSFEWPGKDDDKVRHPPKGYVYLLFENERSVKNLLHECTQDLNENVGEYYFKIFTSKIASKSVQVIPWVISDSSHLTSFTERLDTGRTIFVGGLHGMMTCEMLAQIFNDLFGGVIYTGIDTDKHKYPIGSGRITFNNYQSYAKALNEKFIEIRTKKFVKKVQIDPYLEESQCSMCCNTLGPFFCRDFACFKYFCNNCWIWTHSSTELQSHRPVTRQARQCSKFQSPIFPTRMIERGC